MLYVLNGLQKIKKHKKNIGVAYLFVTEKNKNYKNNLKMIKGKKHKNNNKIKK